MKGSTHRTPTRARAGHPCRGVGGVPYVGRVRRFRRVLLLMLVGLLGYGVGLGQPFLLRPPLTPGQDAVSDVASRAAVVSLDDVGGRVLSIRPVEPARVLFVLYPGGLVRPQAYEWLGRALASRGVHTVIPEFLADLAVVDANRAGALIAHYAEGRPVVLAGHSLGGAMAAGYAADHPGAAAGLVLMASYPAQDKTLAGASLSALSLQAELDGVADADAVRGGLDRLPPGSRLVVVPGAVHSFFGRYGPQAGDGSPTVSRAEAEAVIVEAVAAYLAGVP